MLWRFLFLVCFTTLSLFAVETVRVGVLAKRGSAITVEKWSATAEYLSREVDGYRFEIVPLGFEALYESVERNEIDFVLTNTAYYVELEYLYGVSRIATLKNISSQGDVLTSFGGVIFTKKDSGIKTLDDLKGKRFGAVNISSFGGWIMAEKELHNKGIDIDDFSEFRFFGSHDSVVLAVKEGEIDAGTVRTDTIERMANEGIIDSKVCNVLAPKQYAGFPFKVSTALYPEWPFAKLPLTPDELADKVLIALLQMPSDSKAAESAHVAGWTIPLDYSKVHLLLQELHLGPYAELKKLTFSHIYKKYMWWFYGVLAGFLAVITVLLYISRLNAQLREKKEQIEAMNAGLEQKVHEKEEVMIAHQWRQPITVIAMGANNLLADVELDDVESESVKHSATMMLEQTHHLSKTIDDFKNFFRPNKKAEMILVNDILEENFSIVGKSLENHNIAVEKEYGSQTPIAIYSRELLQVFINILKNAQEALIENEVNEPLISVTTREDEAHVHISICDNGKGIDPSILAKIYDPYFSTKVEKNGTGLGLYMSKTIIEKHLNGQIKAENRKEGGVCFTVSLPKEG
ncbi:MAG: sensor histidine kinase [Campylobacterota bacterium]|nr:sensor histidine kinase [Campylobacterota bacterium]